MILKIATHNKTMHADEVSAIALLKVFRDDEIVVHRVSHDTTDFTKYDMVIDIGKKFDGKKYFDHHQYKGGKSSAGLIWDFIGKSKEYHRISKLIKLIDDNDVGIQKAKPFEFSSLIKCFNSKSLNDATQKIQFDKAVEFAQTVFASMKNMQDDYLAAQDIVKNAYVFDGNQSILELETFTPHWSSYINGDIAPHIKAVVWKDSDENDWKVKIPSKRPGSFELNAKAFSMDDSMKFVHSSGHFAIAKDEESMRKFLEREVG